MKNYNTYIIFFTLFLFACKSETESKPVKEQNQEIVEPTEFKTGRTVFLLDHCDNSLYSVVLEEDKTKGNDTCILRIKSAENANIKIELIELPADKASINYCEKDFVVVGSSCGGPCYTQIFIFTDDRKNKQFDFAQRISNNPNIIAHIKNEEFENLLVHNLKNGKEIKIDISDNDGVMNYGHTVYS